jgi:hypothetical protein
MNPPGSFLYYPEKNQKENEKNNNSLDDRNEQLLPWQKCHLEC